LSRVRALAHNSDMQLKVGASFALLAVLLTAEPLFAQPADESTRTAARALGMAGVEAYQANDFALATDKLEKAYVILRVPSLGLWSGRALVKVGKLVEAADRFLEVTSLQVPTGEYAVQKQAQADAAKELEALRPRIPLLKVAIEGASPAECTVTIDGQPVSSAMLGEGRLVNPGAHIVEGRRGGEVVRAEVTASEGERPTATLTFGAATAAPPSKTEPAPAAPVAAPPPVADAAPEASSAQRAWGWVALGAGGVGIVLGSVTGAIALAKKGEIDDSKACRDNRCLPIEKDLVNSYNAMNSVASVGFIAGGALGALGVVLLLTAPSETSAQAYVGPLSAGVRGRF
jgi:hypothetical protein